MQAGQSWSRPRERSTSSSKSSPRPRHQTGKRSARSSLAENVTNSAQQESMCKIHQMDNNLLSSVSVHSPGCRFLLLWRFQRPQICTWHGDREKIQDINANPSIGSITIFSLIMPDENMWDYVRFDTEQLLLFSRRFQQKHCQRHNGPEG